MHYLSINSKDVHLAANIFPVLCVKYLNKDANICIQKCTVTWKTIKRLSPQDPQTNFGLPVYHRFPWNFECHLHFRRLVSKQISFYLFVHFVYFPRGLGWGQKFFRFKIESFHKFNIFRRALKFNAESLLSVW